MIDGVSWRIIGDDLAKAWADVATKGTATLDDVPTSFQTWSKTIAEARFDAEAEHWNEVLATADPDLGGRPLDPAIDTANTVRSHTVSLPSEVSSALLSSVPAAMNGGVNDVLLTALSLALARWRADRGQGDGTATVLNLEGHGREAELRDRQSGPVPHRRLVHRDLPRPDRSRPPVVVRRALCGSLSCGSPRSR